MTKFIVLYHMPASTMANMPEMTPEQMQEGMKPWMAWAEKCGPALVDLGTPLSGGLAVTSTGSSASTKDVAGYSILEADSMGDCASRDRDTLSQGLSQIALNSHGFPSNL